jgi:hypothetical protein
MLIDPIIQGRAPSGWRGAQPGRWPAEELTDSAAEVSQVDDGGFPNLRRLAACSRARPGDMEATLAFTAWLAL